MIEEEHSFHVAAHGFEDVNAALCWVVRKLDEHSVAQGIKICVETVLVSDAHPSLGGPWKSIWAATISGTLEANTQPQ